MSRNYVKHILIGLFRRNNNQFNKTVPGKKNTKETIPLIIQLTPLQQHPEDNSTFVADNTNVTQLENK